MIVLALLRRGKAPSALSLPTGFPRGMFASRSQVRRLSRMDDHWNDGFDDDEQGEENPWETASFEASQREMQRKFTDTPGRAAARRLISLTRLGQPLPVTDLESAVTLLSADGDVLVADRLVGMASTAGCEPSVAALAGVVRGYLGTGGTINANHADKASDGIKTEAERSGAVNGTPTRVVPPPIGVRVRVERAECYAREILGRLGGPPSSASPSSASFATANQSMQSSSSSSSSSLHPTSFTNICSVPDAAALVSRFVHLSSRHGDPRVAHDIARAAVSKCGLPVTTRSLTYLVQALCRVCGDLTAAVDAISLAQASVDASAGGAQTTGVFQPHIDGNISNNDSKSGSNYNADGDTIESATALRAARRNDADFDGIDDIDGEGDFKGDGGPNGGRTGDRPGPKLFYHALALASRLGDDATALRLLGSMRAGFSIEPDAGCVNSALAACQRAGNRSGALRIAAQLAEAPLSTRMICARFDPPISIAHVPPPRDHVAA